MRAETLPEGMCAVERVVASGWGILALTACENQVWNCRNGSMLPSQHCFSRKGGHGEVCFFVLSCREYWGYMEIEKRTASSEIMGGYHRFDRGHEGRGRQKGTKKSPGRRCNSPSFRSSLSSSPTVYCPSFGATATRSQSYKSVFPSHILQPPARQNMTQLKTCIILSDLLHGSIPNVDIHDERYLQMSFSSTLAASRLTSEPKSEIGEWLPSSLAGAEVVAMVEKSGLWGGSW